MPWHHPLTLHLIPFFSWFYFTKRFSIKEQLYSITIGIYPNWDFGALFYHRMCPMGQDMNHGVGSPLTLVQIIEIFFKIGNIYGSSHEGFKGPSSMHIACFSDIIMLRPSKRA